MIYAHFSEIPWDATRWPNFQPAEFACPHCGEAWYDEESFDLIQAARGIAGPIHLNSAHRCWFHNQRVGGAINSEHKRIAFDISLRNHSPERLLAACREAGFGTFGFYGTFLHVDRRPGRRWITKTGRQTWTSYLTFSASGRPLLPAVSSG